MAEQVMEHILTDRQIKLIKNSWHELKGVDPVLIGDVFYRKLFIDIPEVRRLFTVSREEQAEKLIHTLTLIVARLERLQEITDEIKHLAVRHVNYGVQPKHYAYVGSALIWTLQQVFRTTWNPELEEAWKKCYGILADKMIAAAYGPKEA
jgi:hemoglobin-like flavoprotein